MSAKPASAILALICGLLLASLAQAEDAAEDIFDPAQYDAQLQLSSSELEMERARGAETINIDEVHIQSSYISENATLSDNIIYSSTTGANTISHDAFTGLNGFATVIQNSGNNVIIQNSTIVNFAVRNN